MQRRSLKQDSHDSAMVSKRALVCELSPTISFLTTMPQSELLADLHVSYIQSLGKVRSIPLIATSQLNMSSRARMILHTILPRICA
jgi:hypothetical protein